jgi:LysR family glycine cleavage system transcriptional activator
MTYELPPLNALRAFEAAARHLSFTRAAEELNVTQAAISHQIRNLEDYLQLKLFRRIHRRLILTEDGQIFAPTVREAIEQLATASERLMHRNRSGRVTVSVLPSFASRWLVPRLWKFRDRHPDIDVRLSAFEWLVDFERDGVDLAIRYGKGSWPGTEAALMMHEKVFPVCSPSLLEKTGPLEGPDDLKRVTLLHDDFAREDWKHWFRAAGVKTVDPKRGLSFSHTSIMLEAVESGQGVALAQAPLVADDLAKGRLVKPLALELEGEYSYYVVTPTGQSNRPGIAEFRDWLLEEAVALIGETPH